MSRLRVARNVLWRYGAKMILTQAAGRAAGSVLRAVAPSALPRLRRRRIEGWSPSWVAPDPELRAEIIERAARNWPTQPLRGGEFYIQEDKAFTCNLRKGRLR